MQRRGMLIVVGTGIQWGGQTTLAARAAIEKADCVLFAVADEHTAHWIRTLAPGAESLRYPRDGRPRKQIYREMVERIVSEVRNGKKVCTVFYGHPGVLADAPHEGGFIVPSRVRRGDLQVAVSTSGRSPRIAASLRDRIAALLEEQIAQGLSR